MEQRADAIVVEELGEGIPDAGERIDGAAAAGSFGLEVIGLEQIPGAVAHPEQEPECRERCGDHRDTSLDAAAETCGAEATPGFDRSRQRDHDSQRAGARGQGRERPAAAKRLVRSIRKVATKNRRNSGSA